MHDEARALRARTARAPRNRNERIRTRGNRTTRGRQSSANDRAQRRMDARRVVRPSAGARCGWIATITHPRDDASQRGFEQMETGIGLARRLSRVARGAARRALSILTAGAGRAGYAVDARVASAGPLYIGAGWFLIGAAAARPGAAEFALFDDRFATTARHRKEET
ncbi:hypothetical protein [Burkholderia pseudomallei]|uniref:hypothetical protein n=1 Tax=Burkholderia pseudomallei TaxID=28450 RepID=UPI000A1A07F3|nr:hypothetical protein [Burkholderia pseudomallei]ARK45750.1 hypothetical protein BOC35_04850 [Burkholderia pseudomallei]ARK55726.1 hypothetical protein BOC36_21400 [Burkholderia pseudomallei]ARL20671.1 hypothetical protein BOC46_36710 [Burkholderia pseudomallei]ARL27633.1 hypothetical protein BOC47_37195 [Burkholderia pseudomallei]ARL33454.1 hypothetical protein BOC48_30345 [Burkholderia pseudomallei]